MENIFLKDILENVREGVYVWKGEDLKLKEKNRVPD